ncbi:hypothetical protein QKT26_gp60 [Carcinus maenas nudivirus]|uniref:Uncharacterized protein n=1 Tax=Carcinus maenas nudivirus TaxID=2880837 RepID=A0AAE9C000_9VIRU|nr:hypothetical protein QKT26_gp60 [Carcinus maenas nudivirus]UBZ25650.1 hypothetical protein CmNV_059 [Carcinus maenas nudivirus]
MATLKEFEKKMLYNMTQLSGLREFTKNNVAITNLHSPQSNTLPNMTIEKKERTINDDIEELSWLKELFVDECDEDEVEELLLKLSSINRMKFNSKHCAFMYYNNSGHNSSFRLCEIDKNIQVSYRNGYFYNIDEDIDTIIDYTTESIPAIFKLKAPNHIDLKNHHISQSINAISCRRFNPNSLSIHTPYN